MTKPNVELKLGQKAVARLRKGQEVTVGTVNGDWFGCWTTSMGAAGREEAKGWLHKSDVKLAWYDVVVKSLGPPCRRGLDGNVMLEADQLGKIKNIPRIDEIEELHVVIMRAPKADEKTQTGFVALGAVKNLKRLTFLGPFADENLASLRGLTNLELLQLRSRSPKFTGAGLKYLKDLPKLRALGLSGDPEIRESALQHITELAKLQTLALDDTWLTLETIDDLRQALPNCGLFSSRLHLPPDEKPWKPVAEPKEPAAESKAEPAKVWSKDPLDDLFGPPMPQERERIDRKSPKAPKSKPSDDPFS